LSRLRSVLGPIPLHSRPYRLLQPLASDLGLVREHLAHGRFGAAVAAYRGPVLPTSQAPAVVQLREDLHGDLRAALLTAGDPDALLRLADTASGRADYELWFTALATLPPGSPRRAQVEAHVRRLGRELA
jgi:hypothetical protein